MNSHGRIVGMHWEVCWSQGPELGFPIVSNMNQPFQGTIANKIYSGKELEIQK